MQNLKKQYLTKKGLFSYNSNIIIFCCPKSLANNDNDIDIPGLCKLLSPESWNPLLGENSLKM